MGVYTAVGYSCVMLAVDWAHGVKREWGYAGLPT